MWMTLEHPIPSSLYLNQTKTFIYVLHDNQPQTCNKCGHEGHLRRDCKVKFCDWLNIVDIDVSEYEFDTDSEGEGEQEAFECPECDQKCANQSRLDEHMTTHTEEYSNEDITQEENKSITKSEDASIEKVNENTDSQVSEIFACSECEFECTNKSNRDEHMRTHIGEQNLVQQSEIQNEQNSETDINQCNIEVHVEPSQKRKLI